MVADISVNAYAENPGISSDNNNHDGCFTQENACDYLQNYQTINELANASSSGNFINLASHIAADKFHSSASPFLCIKFQEPDQSLQTEGSKSKFYATVESRTQLTFPGAKIDKYELILNVQPSFSFNLLPGDSILFHCPNCRFEVDYLLHRLNLADFADKECQLSIDENTTKKIAKVPIHLPSFKTLRNILTWNVDIRRVISKPLIRVLADYCSNLNDAKEIYEISNTSQLMDEVIRIPGLSLLDILNKFPSCYPPVERLFEFLLRLQPRHLSIANRPNTEGKLRFIYSLVETKCGCKEGKVYCRRGVCSGYLSTLLPNKSSILLETRSIITKFRFGPDFYEKPILLIALGTGVAPFLSLLDSIKNEESPKNIHQRYLFFGCRHPDKDYIVRNELENYLELGILSKVIVAYSETQSGKPKIHVQEKLSESKNEVGQLLENQTSVVAFCGGNKEALASIKNVLVEIWSETSGKDLKESCDSLNQMEKTGRFFYEIWS